MTQGDKPLLMGNESDYVYQFSQEFPRAEHITLLNVELPRLSSNYQHLVKKNKICYAVGPGLEDQLSTPALQDFKTDARAIGVYIHKDALSLSRQVVGYANKNTSPSLHDVVEYLRTG